MHRHLVALLTAACVASVIAPGAASADTTLNCRGAVALDNPKESELSYSFGCNEEILGYSIVLPLEIDSFGVTGSPVNRSDGEPSEAEGSKAFECEGEIPGYGFGCVGGTLVTSAFATGHFTALESPCGPDLPRRIRGWLSVMFLEGEGEKQKTKVSHPFPLKAAKCPKSRPRGKSKKARRNR